jgi:putative lipoprotein
MKRIVISLFILLIVSMLLGCSKTSTVSGIITYTEEIALPTEGVVVTVKVEDISRADAPAVTIGQQVIENPGQVPIPFEVEYNTSDIDDRYVYALRVRIEVDGKLWFINTSRYAVITRGSPTSNIEVIVQKQG